MIFIYNIYFIFNKGVMTTIAGTGTLGYNGDNIEATFSQLRSPHGLSFDNIGNLFIADYQNHRIRKVELICPPGTYSLAGSSSW
jgi:hypothetical protein